MDKVFKNKKILVMGLGLNGGGVGVAKFFYKQGAEVLVTDLKKEEQLTESLEKLKGLKIKYRLGGHKEDDFISADLIIKNPDVPTASPYLEVARINKIPIETDLSLFFKLSGAFIVGVTGAKGKSTTASLIFNILKAKFKRTFLAGNIGVSPLEILPKIKKGDKVVLELSSFGLDNLEQGPNIAVLTNIYPDHLNRYGTMQNYIESKKRIFKFQNKNDALVLNEDDEVVRKFAKEAKSKIYFYSAQKNIPAIKLEKIKLSGKHNIANILAAATVGQILGISKEKIQKAVSTFKGVPNRQEFVKEINGVKYFNDTTATMPSAVIAAIEAFSDKFLNSKIVLIAGGQDKGLDYKEMAQRVKEKVFKLVLLPGTASEKIKKELDSWQQMEDAASIQEAVNLAAKMAERGDMVLLSPGAASFNLFKNEFDRGNQFKKIVKELK